MRKLLLLLFVFTAPCFADVNEGEKAFESGDYATALRILKPLAETGDAKAQFYVGKMYYLGKGAPQDHAQAIRFYRKAADQGHAKAQNDLGTMYVSGRGVDRDDAQAVTWFRKAADQGNADAQFNLGVMYLKGQGETRDLAQAGTWFRKAAEQGNANAQFNLAVMHDYGRGVTKNRTQATEWYRKAAEQGNKSAEARLNKSPFTSISSNEDDFWNILGAVIVIGVGAMLLDSSSGQSSNSNDEEYAKWRALENSRERHEAELLEREQQGLEADMQRRQWVIETYGTDR